MLYLIAQKRLAVLPEHASERMTIWPWTGQSEALGLWKELVCLIPYSVGDLKKEEKNNYKEKNIRDPANKYFFSKPSRTRFYCPDVI